MSINSMTELLHLDLHCLSFLNESLSHDVFLVFQNLNLLVFQRYQFLKIFDIALEGSNRRHTLFLTWRLIGYLVFEATNFVVNSVDVGHFGLALHYCRIVMRLISSHVYF